MVREIGEEAVRYYTYRGEFIGFTVRSSNNVDKLRSTGIELGRRSTRVEFNTGPGKEKQCMRCT